MRVFMALVAAVAVVGLSLSSARAKEVDLTSTRSQVKAACGADYYSNLDGYGCVKQNCDHKGGTCSVSCTNDGSCKGNTPGRIVSTKGRMLGSILSPGEKVSLNPQPLPPKTDGSLLENSHGLSPQGPSATGTPVATPSAAGVR